MKREGVMKLGLLKELKDRGWKEKDIKNLIMFEVLGRKIIRGVQNDSSIWDKNGK